MYNQSHPSVRRDWPRYSCCVLNLAKSSPTHGDDFTITSSVTKRSADTFDASSSTIFIYCVFNESSSICNSTLVHVHLTLFVCKCVGDCESGWQVRSVACVDQTRNGTTTTKTQSQLCSAKSKPAQRQRCLNCAGRWLTTAWSPVNGPSCYFVFLSLTDVVLIFRS